MLVLLQAAAIGGDLRVALEPGEDSVAWRGSGEAYTVARRMRDTASCGLWRAGQYALLDGCRYVHEVTRVSGAVARLSLSVTMSCHRPTRDARERCKAEEQCA